METPSFDGLVRKAIQKGLDGMILSPERDAVVFDAVKSSVQSAYESGVKDTANPRRNYLYAIGVLLALSLLVFAAVWATPRFPALSLQANKSPFAEGAPSWELTILGDSQAEVQGDAVVIDAKAKMTNEWGFGGSVQYKDYLYIRTVNYADSTQVRVLVYHWTVLGGWQYYDEQDI